MPQSRVSIIPGVSATSRQGADPISELCCLQLLFASAAAPLELASFHHRRLTYTHFVSCRQWRSSLHSLTLSGHLGGLANLTSPPTFNASSHHHHRNHALLRHILRL